MAKVPFNVTNKTCATCKWWCGAREVTFAVNSPLHVKADTAPAKCIATPTLPRGPGASCPRYQRWEKL